MSRPPRRLGPAEGRDTEGGDLRCPTTVPSPTERYFIDWRDRWPEGPWPRPGQTITLLDGRPAIVDTAHGPKLTVDVGGQATL